MNENKDSQPFTLEQWQQEALDAILGRCKPEDSNRFKEICDHISRKNGKTNIASEIIVDFLRGSIRDVSSLETPKGYIDLMFPNGEIVRTETGEGLSLQIDYIRMGDSENISES